MKCPKYIAAMLAAGGPVDQVEAECDKEECAWWNAELNQCDPTGVLLTVKNIWQALDSMTIKGRD